MNYLDKRSKDIKDMIEEAQKNRAISQQELKGAQDQLRQTKEQVLEMKNTAIKEVDQYRRLTMEEAKEEAVSLLERAKLEIRKEAVSAKDQLKGEISSLSVEIAKRILDREVKDADHKKLIEDSIEELANE